MPQPAAYTIFPLGDHALTLDFGNEITPDHHQQVLSLYHLLQEQPLHGMVEAVPAYSSLTVFYKPLQVLKHCIPNQTAFEWMKEALGHMAAHAPVRDLLPARLIRIPVCYEFPYAKDLPAQAEKLKMSAEEIIQLHLSRCYTVYMLGFMPGFSYMGEVDEKIAMPRKPVPEFVRPGSVGIAGRQTGIYPFTCPGGWHIIGRTPVKMFDIHAADPVLLDTGDHIEFYRITADEFENYQGGHS